MTDTLARTIAILAILLVVSIGALLLHAGYVGWGLGVLGGVVLAACVASMWRVERRKREGRR